MWIISKMSFRLLYLFSDFMYYVLYYIFSYRKKVVRKNLKLAFPEMSSSERTKIEKKYYKYLADIFLESFKSMNISEDEMKTYARKMTEFAEWCTNKGMPISYHHHMAAVIETEKELDSFMNHSGEALQLLYDTGHMAFAGGDVLRVIDKHHKRISHVHTKDVRQKVLDKLDRNKESFLDSVVKGVFTVPGDGNLNFQSIVTRLASCGYEGWFVVEAEQDPAISPPLQMAQLGHRELIKIIGASGYQIEK